VRSNYDQNGYIKNIAEGSYGRVLDAKRFDNAQTGGFPIFLRMAVIDVISDPQMIDDVKLTYWEHTLQVSNIKYASVAPRNSIIARRVLNISTAASEQVLVMYPMMSHITLPVKPGEHVWAFFENPDAKVNELGYWISKIVEPNFVDDVNHTHSNRQLDPSYSPGTIDKANGTSVTYDFPNGAVGIDSDGNRYVVGQTATLPGDEKSYENLITGADASKLLQIEQVPRYRGRPGELFIEGSNNSLIVLGTDRTSTSAQYDADPDTGNVPKIPDTDLPGERIGTFDLVAGRGQTSATAGAKVKNSLGFNELGKSKDELVIGEGDPDYKNDRTRIAGWQRTKVDTKLQIDKAVSAHSGGAVSDGSQGEGATIMRSDKIRLVARQDLVILVTGDNQRDEQGRIIDAPIDPDKCASVIIKTNGEIIFTPAKSAVVKLGGPKASKAILCTNVNNGGAGGQVTASPIVDTMGGAQGAADGINGTFSTKVLIE
jgi:hypothetical protein